MEDAGESTAEPTASDGPVDLLELDDIVETFATVRLQATLREAVEALERRSAKVVLITRTAVAMRNGVYGVLDRDGIETSVRYRAPN
jgi:hypothetical protein